MLQKVVGKMRKAIEDYNMIEDGDKIGSWTFRWKR